MLRFFLGTLPDMIVPVAVLAEPPAADIAPHHAPAVAQRSALVAHATLAEAPYHNIVLSLPPHCMRMLVARIVRWRSRV